MDRLGDVLDIWMEEGVKSSVFPRKIFDEWIAECPGLHTKQWGIGWVDVCQGSAETLGASHCCLVWTGVPRNALVMAGSTKHCSLVTGHVLHSCWSYPDPWCEHLRSSCLDLLPQWWRPSLSWHHQQGVNMSSCGQPEHRGCLQWGSRCTCQREDVIRRPKWRINAVVCSLHSSWNIHLNEESYTYTDILNCIQ